MHPTTKVELDHIASIREILIPFLRSGVEIVTTEGEPVTLANLPDLCHSGASIEMMGVDGELIALTLPDLQRPDTKRPEEIRPAFTQIADSGKQQHFWPAPADEIIHVRGSYRPEPLELGKPLLGIRRDKAGRIHRLRVDRFRRVTRHLPID